MTVGRAGRIAAIAILFLICMSCGDTFRPVAIPLQPKPPDPGGFHYVLAISDNGANNPGSSTRIDVSGDTNVGVARVGLAPSYAALIPNGARVYVTNTLEDSVSSYSPSSQTVVTTITLPAGAHPTFIATAQNDEIFVTNSGNATVSGISVGSNVVTDNIPVGTNPVALVETPDNRHLYVANQGSNSVTSIDPADRLVQTTIIDPSISSPVWMVTRSDSARAYVLSSGSGKISTIDTTTDTVINSVAVDPGANFMFYDKPGNRIYVTNPTNTLVRSFSVASDPPVALPVIDLSAGANAPCPSGCSPVSVTVLPDDSRVYIASYQIVPLAPPCDPYDPTDLNPCSGITSQVSVMNWSDNSLRTNIPLGTAWVDTHNVTGCSANSAGMPLVRFRLSTAAAIDSTRVYVGKCDAGNVAVINATAGSDSLVALTGTQTGAGAGLDAPLSAFPPQQPAGGQPPTQNPVFLLVGP